MIKKTTSEIMKMKWQDPAYRQMQVNSHKGYKQTKEHIEKVRKYLIGRPVSIETRKKIGDSKIGNKYMLNKKHTQETKNKIGNKNKGKKFSDEHKEKLSKSHIGLFVGEKNYWFGKKLKGENSHAWIKDRTKLAKHDDRGYYGTDSASKDWSKKIKDRDGWKCKINNSDCIKKVEAHHILGWKEYPELRYDLNNGITLCKFHHPRSRIKEKELSPYFISLIKQHNANPQ